MFSFSFLHVKKKVTKKLFFISHAFLSIFLFSGLQQIYCAPLDFARQNPNSQILKGRSIDRSMVESADKERVENFLKYVMIKNHGLFTLLGSKPMTAFYFYPAPNEQEKRIIYEAQSEQLKKQISFEKFHPNRDDCKQVWKDWKAIEKKYLGKQFLFVEDEELEHGIFINIQTVTFILDKYYEEFSKVVQQPFNPDKAVYLIGNSSESFWQKIKKSDYLMGLLFGFGEKNAQYFQWEKEGKAHYFFRRYSENFCNQEKKKKEMSVEDLDIPEFIAYQTVDEQEERYKLEREKCIQLYKNQDFVELTVRLLKGINR